MFGRTFSYSAARERGGREYVVNRTSCSAFAAVAGVILVLFGCGDQHPTAPTSVAPTAQLDRIGASTSDTALTPELVRALAAQRGIGRLASAPYVRSVPPTPT